MKILYNNKLSLSNKEETQADGPYRMKDFVETVSFEELRLTYEDIETDIKKVHPEYYLNKIKEACNTYSEMAEQKLSPETYESLLVSSSLAILASNQNDFAVARPGGHHASEDKAEGFCFINHEAVATQKLLDEGKRVAIIDFDGHHGNGTQAIFKDEPDVFFASIHQIGQYPHTGDFTDQGEGPSIGHVLNIPLYAGSGDDLLIKSLEVILERVKNFKPDVICLTAGFDGYSKDNLLSLNFSYRGFYEIGKMISKMNLPTFAVSAGGYHHDLKNCINSFISGFNGTDFVFEDMLTTSQDHQVNHFNALIRFL